jgi:hypothetical protein
MCLHRDSSEISALHLLQRSRNWQTPVERSQESNLTIANPDVKQVKSRFSKADTVFVCPLERRLIKAIQRIRFSTAGQELAVETAG